MIQVKGLTIIYRGQPALWNVNANFPKGQLTAVIGPNGAGKSTLLRAILGLIKPIQGDVTFNGLPLTRKEKQDIAYVPQRESVDWSFPVTCFDVVLMGTYGKLGLLKKPGLTEKRAAEEALKQMGMLEYRDRHISELSGGQKQRIFLARALVQNAHLYVLDEPFGGVDAKTEKMTLNLLTELRAAGKTIIVVTHDMSSLGKYFDHIVLLNTQLVAEGSPENVLTPENLSSAYGGMMHMVGDGQ